MGPNGGRKKQIWDIYQKERYILWLFAYGEDEKARYKHDTPNVHAQENRRILVTLKI